ncbi:hypothetical protein ACFYKX_11210 [Cytobacillus sp. FJAT-54145]|uniref:Uncharacterized protein n=1 Tax=Cytobacillus spartinae TaxID=3299023 RepID=A0ABW6KE43_9BACI
MLTIQEIESLQDWLKLNRAPAIHRANLLILIDNGHFPHLHDEEELKGLYEEVQTLRRGLNAEKAWKLLTALEKGKQENKDLAEALQMNNQTVELLLKENKELKEKVKRYEEKGE